MPDRPTPDRPIGRDTPKGQTNNALIISLVLAGVVAVLILGGATFFNSDEKSADATTTPPSTETPVPFSLNFCVEIVPRPMIGSHL